MRTILVTGASRGLGAAIAKLFLDKGDLVYINYNKSEKEAYNLFQKYPYARLIKADVSSETEVKNMIRVIKEEVGSLDVIINNAGIAIDTTLDDKTVANFNKILNTNLIGPFLVIKYARSLLNNNSNVINISSTNGIDTYYPYSMDYDASKAGLISLTHNMAVELAPIRVNAVAPGWINTSMNKELDKEYIEEECENILLKRFAEPKEIAEVVFFLASDKASYINNTVLRVDGGIK